MKLLLLFPLLLPALPALANQDTAPGRQMAEAVFTTIPGSETGTVGIDAVLEYGSDVRLSMDADDDGAIDLDEFKSWGFGMQNLAEDKDRTAALETALRVVHVVWDLDGNGKVSAPEHAQSLSADFIRSDRDGDGMLTETEFLEGFLILRAMKAAIKDSSDSSGH